MPYVSSPIAPGFNIPGIIIHSVPAPGRKCHFVFYKYVTASQLYWRRGDERGGDRETGRRGNVRRGKTKDTRQKAKVENP